MKVGMLGGTFDPVHIGHLIIAEEVREKLGLEAVIFLPAGQPWIKADRTIASGEHRLQMLKLALGSNPFFKLSSLELERKGSTYSVDTISILRAELGPGVQLYFIVGFDALRQLPQWKEPASLIQMCQMVGVKRPGCSELDLPALEAVVPGISHRLTLLDVPQIGISSSEIRERVARGLSIRYLVPEAVEEYIRNYGLYREIRKTKGGR